MSISESDFCLFISYFTDNLPEKEKATILKRLKDEDLWEKMLKNTVDIWLDGSLTDEQEAFFMNFLDNDPIAKDLCDLRVNQVAGKDNIHVLARDIYDSL